EGDGPLKEDLGKIHSSGKTLLALINDLLDPARLQGAIDGAHISAFGAQMRHELRTPVNAVIGYAEMLVEDEASLEPGVVEDLRKIHAAGKKLLAFVDDIIHMSKVVSGNADVAMASSGGLATIIQDVVTTIKPLEPEAARRTEHPGGRLLVVDD